MSIRRILDRFILGAHRPVGVEDDRSAVCPCCEVTWPCPTTINAWERAAERNRRAR